MRWLEVREPIDASAMRETYLARGWNMILMLDYLPRWNCS
jgi:hypothetical protein